MLLQYNIYSVMIIVQLIINTPQSKIVTYGMQSDAKNSNVYS